MSRNLLEQPVVAPACGMGALILNGVLIAGSSLVIAV